MPDAPTPLDLDAIEAHEHAPALVEEVNRLRAEVARLAPAWDEEAVVEGMARAVYPFLFTDGRQPLRVFGEARSDAELREGERDVARERMRQALAVVRDHQPVKPDRETIERALRDAGLVEVVAVHERHGAEEVVYAHLRPVVDAVLAEWPGESRAQVGATALRDAVEKYAITIPDALGYKVPAVTTEDLLDRADRLAAEGGAS